MKIEMIVGPNGKAIPAQRIRTVYAREEDRLSKIEFSNDNGERFPLYVSHFETCPYAKDFSRSRPKSSGD
jgi:hypothetical protein